MSSYLVRQLAEIREQIADLKRGKVTHRLAQVTTADATASTFAAALPDGQVLSGVASPEQFLPQTGQWVRLRLQGATPIYEPAGIAENAVTGRELAPGSVVEDNLTQDLLDSLGGALIHRQPTQPADPPAGRQAYWWDESDSNRLRQYNSGTDTWDPVLFGNGAIDPDSLIASDVLVDGTVSAELLEALLVLASVLIAGDPNGEHTRIDSTGVTNYAVGDDGLPMELGRQGRGWSVRNPDTGLVVSSGTDDGEISARTISTTDPDPSFGGVLLSEHMWDKPWGLVADGRYPATGGASALTNTELGFMELGFQAQPGRAYRANIEGVQPINNTTTGGWMLRVRHTTDGTAPTVTSFLLREYNTDGTVDVGWNTKVPQIFRYNGPPLGSPEFTARLLFSYAAGTGAASSQGAGIYRDRDVFFWIEDVGPQVLETGDETSGGGTAISGTPPPSGGTTTRQSYTYEAAPNWQRTWGQNNSSIVTDSEMQQGYADSFNGHRRSSAGWTGLPTLLTGATITEVAFYVESYHWYNMSGGLLRMGYHGVTAEPATFPGQVDPGNVGFTARAQGKWFTRNEWAAGIKSGAIRGISFLGADNSATYYGKFRGEGYGSGRPRIRVKYTK